MKMSELVSKTIEDMEVATAKKNKDAVFSVNDILPDASGNVEIEITAGGGIEVEKFGAIGDGITDDTAAFTRAIAESPEGTRFLLSKTYLVKTFEVLVGCSKNVTFIGQITLL
jgi:polygalacturonase